MKARNAKDLNKVSLNLTVTPIAKKIAAELKKVMKRQSISQVVEVLVEERMQQHQTEKHKAA